MSLFILLSSLEIGPLPWVRFLNQSVPPSRYISSPVIHHTVLRDNLHFRFGHLIHELHLSFGDLNDLLNEASANFVFYFRDPI